MTRRASWMGAICLSVAAAGCGGDFTAPEQPAAGPEVAAAVGLTVSISGPTYVAPGSCGTWHAQASGGMKPYTYDWTPTSGTASGSSFSHCFPTQPTTTPLTIDVVVTDATWDTAWERIAVYSDGSGGA